MIASFLLIFQVEMERPAMKRIRMNIGSTALVNSIQIEILPREILCIIFSYLDKKSVQNATATCKLWFELIRNDKGLSSYVCFEKNVLEELLQEIRVGKWSWAGWPILKKLKFGCLSAAKNHKEITSYLPKLANFNGCPTLEKVVFSVSCTMAVIFPQFSFHHLTNAPLGIIEELTFDPKFELESVGIEHVSGLELTMEGVLLSSWDRAKDISKHLKLLKETAHHLKTLTIICKDLLDLDRYCGIDSIVDIGEDSVGEYKLLKNSFGQLFEELGETLESLYVVVVGDISYINHFFSDSTPITEIWIKGILMSEIRRQRAPIYSKSDELTKLFHRFKKLKKCRVDLTLTEENEDQNCSTWPDFVNDTFREAADFKFRFIYSKQIKDGYFMFGKHQYNKVVRFEITHQ